MPLFSLAESLLGRRYSRRSALKIIGLGVAGLTAGPLSRKAQAGPLQKALAATSLSKEGQDFSPVDRSLDERFSASEGLAPRVFSGDRPDRSHRILWDKKGYLAAGNIKRPAEDQIERTRVAIVGGGVSGITTAFLLRDHKPILLERAERFGGNARGESWKGLDYSIGAAYFMEQDKNSPLRTKLFDPCGITEGFYRVKTTDDPVIKDGHLPKNAKRGVSRKMTRGAVYQGTRYNAFWTGESDPGNEAQYRILERHFKNVFEGKNGYRFPDLPIPANADAKYRRYIERLDRKSFKEHLEEVVAGYLFPKKADRQKFARTRTDANGKTVYWVPLRPQIEAAMEHYCWSSFGALFSGISAAAGLNFYAAEFGDVYIAPGGNSAVAERILEKVQESIGSSNLRPSCVVFHVEVETDGKTVVIGYEDSQGKPRWIRADAVVMSCPKFVASRILENIEPERVEAIQKLKYHSYLVANVLIQGPVKRDFYDLFLIGDGTVNASNIGASVDRQGVTDIVLGTFAQPEGPTTPEPANTVLTLYRGIPYEGARGMVYADGAYEKYRREFEEQIRTQILKLAGVTDAARLQDLRITRWGHPLPMAERGLFASGVLDKIQKPHKGRVFFIEQDNWMLPAFETGTTEAIQQEAAIRAVLERA